MLAALLRKLKRRLTRRRAPATATAGRKLHRPEVTCFPDGIAGIRPTFDWRPIAGAIGHRVSLRELDTGETVFFRDIPAPPFTADSDIAPGEYVWYVKVFFADGDAISKGRIVAIHPPDDLERITREIEAERAERAAANEEFVANAAKLTPESNRALRRDELAERRCELASLPSTLLLNIGHNCNIDCIMCGSGRQIDSRVVPGSFIDDLDHYIPLLDDLLVSGGEPLLYPKMLDTLIEKVERHADAGVRISIHTNGSLITRQMAERFRSGPFRNISVSVDGASREIYESIRLRSNFPRILEALEALADANHDGRLKVSLTFVVMKRNRHEPPAFVEMARRFGVSEVVFQPMRTQLFRDLVPENVLYSVDLCRNVLDTLAEAEAIADEHGIAIVDKVRPFLLNMYPELISRPAEHAYLPDYFLDLGVEKDIEERVRCLSLQCRPDLDAKRIHPSIDEEAFRATRKEFFCGVPFTNLNVDVDDSLICCNAMRRFYCIPYGRTWRHLGDIWNCDAHKQARELMHAGRGNLDVCHPLCAFYHEGGFDPKRDGYLWV